MPNATAEQMLDLLTRAERRKLKAIMRRNPNLTPKAQIAAIYS